MLFVEEESLDGSCYFIENREDAFNLGVIFDRFPEECGIAPFVDDIFLNCSRLSDVVFSVDEVREVGEVQSKVEFVLLEPLVALGVGVVHVGHFEEGKKVSQGLSKTSDSPVCQLYFSGRRLEGSSGREVGSMDCIGPKVISSDFWEFFEVVSDSPPEAVVLVLARVESFKVGEGFGKQEVDEGQVA